ncbi:MAG: DUF554 domain-containing protein [Firmicutes bacterium]|nr:DUF554 domain-containing protein [Bacillota bacterium]
MLGTIINVVLIFAGSLAGLFLRGRLPEQYVMRVMEGVALIILLLGLDMAMTETNILLVLTSLVIGGLLGEYLQIEERLHNWSQRVEKRFATKGGDGFARGFITASLLFAVGPLAIMGAFDAGLRADYTILINKGIIDGVTAAALAASLGWGVAFSGVTILVYQGALTLLAFYLKNLLNDPAVAAMTATGGLLIVALGLGMLEIKKIKVANFLPSLFVAVFLAFFWV